jgi:hypothetical protein
MAVCENPVRLIRLGADAEYRMRAGVASSMAETAALSTRDDRPDNCTDRALRPHS